MKADSIWTALRERYAAPAFAYFEEVRNGTGYMNTVRTADALAFGLWPSRGLELHGIEVKVSRSDWKRELADPAKAEEIGRFCDRWWLATTEGCAEAEEIPAAWGWMVFTSKGKLKTFKEAPERKPESINRAFLASLFRKLYNREQAVVRGQVDKLMAEERDRERETITALRNKVTAAALAQQDAERLAGYICNAVGIERDELGRLRDADRQRLELFHASTSDGLRAAAERAAEQLKRVAIEARAVLRAGGVRVRRPKWRTA